MIKQFYHYELFLAITGLEVIHKDAGKFLFKNTE